jgi:uncharacterized protein (TIGR03437 family)
MLAAQSVAPPAINPGGVVNDASRMPPSLPGGALAAGSRFRMEGLRFGPAMEVRADPRHPRPDLGGVTVTARAGEQSWKTPLLSASAVLIEGVLSPEIPVGDATLTVSYGGQSSVPYQIRVAPSNFGIYTRNGKGWGTGRWQPAIDASHPAHPGDAISLIGSGLGWTAAQRHAEIFVGGQPARRNSWIRPAECCAGAQEIRFVVPANAPLNCDVPVVVRTGPGTVSNVALLDIAQHGEPCRRQQWALSPATAASRAGWAIFWHTDIMVRVHNGKLADFTGEAVSAVFRQKKTVSEAEERFTLLEHLPPPGTCTASTGTGAWRDLVAVLSPESRKSQKPLDAGEDYEVAGEHTKRTLALGRGATSDHSGLVGGSLPAPGLNRPLPLILISGSAQFSVPGGRDIPTFTVAVPVPEFVVWTNRDAVEEVDRARGVTVRWNAPKGSIILAGAVNADAVTGAAGICMCAATAEARSFDLPSLALANLPATSPENESLFSLVFVVALPRDAIDKQVNGLDVFNAAFGSSASRSVVFR